MGGEVCLWHRMKQLSNISPSVSQLTVVIRPDTHQLVAQHATTDLNGPPLLCRLLVYYSACALVTPSIHPSIHPYIKTPIRESSSISFLHPISNCVSPLHSLIWKVGLQVSFHFHVRTELQLAGNYEPLRLEQHQEVMVMCWESHIEGLLQLCYRNTTWYVRQVTRYVTPSYSKHQVWIHKGVYVQV